MKKVSTKAMKIALNELQSLGVVHLDQGVYRLVHRDVFIDGQVMPISKALRKMRNA